MDDPIKSIDNLIEHSKNLKEEQKIDQPIASDSISDPESAFFEEQTGQIEKEGISKSWAN